MYAISLSCVALILQLLPSVANANDQLSLTREVNKDVVFMFTTNTSTNITEAVWGIRDGDTSNFKLVLIAVDRFSEQIRYNAGYDGRVSFVGDLSKGQAWFKITNLNINDTNKYTARIILQGASSYKFSDIRLNVIQPVSPVTTRPLQKSTRELTTAASSSQTSPRPTSEMPQMSNRSITIKVMKKVYGNSSDANSHAFKTFSEKFLFEINSVYKNIHTFEKAKITRLSENIIPVTFVVFFKNMIKPDEICRPLKDAVKDNRLGSLKIVPGSLECSSEPSRSFPKNQSSSVCTCTSIIAACTTIIIFLILVVVVLLFYIWRGRSNAEKGAESRGSSSVKDKDLESYENVHQMEDTSQRTTTKTARASNEKEIYETIKENRNKDTAAIKANVKPSRGPSVGVQGDVPPLPQHYQDLQIKATHSTPLYEPLKQRGFGNKKEVASEDPKTYEHLQQSASGREYQSLKSYKDSESKV